MDFSDTGERLRGKVLAHQQAGLDEPLSICVDAFAIRGNSAARAQVADHVPVQSGHVVSTGSRNTVPHGQMTGATDFLIEEDASGERRNFVVVADRELTETSGAVIQGKELVRKFLAALRFPPRHEPVFKLDPDILGLAPMI